MDVGDQIIWPNTLSIYDKKNMVQLKKNKDNLETFVLNNFSLDAQQTV